MLRNRKSILCLFPIINIKAAEKDSTAYSVCFFRRVSPLRNYILPNFTFILYSILDTLSIKLPYSLSKKVQESRNYR